jgi:FkbM family methyltransferase
VTWNGGPDVRSLAVSPVAPVLGQRVPLRGPARILYRSYARSDRRPGERRTVTTKFGDRFDISLASFLEWQLWAFGSYEEHFAALFQRLVRPGERCVDVGANIGIHTIRLARLAGAAGEVLAVEPDAELASRIERNANLNGLANVRVIQAAASRSSGGTVRLFRPEGADPNRGRASLLPHVHLTGPAQEVPVVRIDDVADGPVALIKIDVEGHEEAVVAGAAGTIQSYSPSIIFEHAPDLLDGKAASPFGQLREWRYDLFRIRDDRHRVTGRGGLSLESISAPPATTANILAVRGPMADRIGALAAGAGGCDA